MWSERHDSHDQADSNFKIRSSVEVAAQTACPQHEKLDLVVFLTSIIKSFFGAFENVHYKTIDDPVLN